MSWAASLWPCAAYELPAARETVARRFAEPSKDGTLHSLLDDIPDPADAGLHKGLDDVGVGSVCRAGART